jgi:hypothetical protein
MKSIVLLSLFLVVFLTGCSEEFTRALVNAYAEQGRPFYIALQEEKYPEDATKRKAKQQIIIIEQDNKVTSVPAVSMDQYGRPIKMEVQGQPQVSGELLKVKPNAYGLGVGMDQYGRPVKAVSAY